jgi:hypothetical protein
VPGGAADPPERLLTSTDGIDGIRSGEAELARCVSES